MSVELVMLTDPFISSFHLLLLPSVFASIRVVCNETYIYTNRDIFSCVWYLFTFLLVFSFYQFKKPYLPLCLLSSPILNIIVLNIFTIYVQNHRRQCYTFCFNCQRLAKKLKRRIKVYFIYPYFCLPCSFFPMFKDCCFYYFLSVQRNALAILLEEVCWRQIPLVFLHLRMF